MHELFREFIISELVRNPRLKLADDQSLIRGGIIDSFSLVQVGLFIEDKWNLRVPDRDLTVEKMDTINQMVNYVESRLAK